MSTETAYVQIELADGKKAGETLNELTSTAARLASEIKKSKVGSEEYVRASGDLKKVNAEIKSLKGEIWGTKQASEELTKQFGSLIPFNAQFQQFKNTFGNMVSGLRAAATASNLLKFAMLAIPVFALIAGITTLVKWFTSTQEGMDKVTSVTRPLLAVFEKMKGVVQELGGSVFKGLAMILKGDVAEGLKTIGSGFVDSIDNTKKAITEGVAAGKELDQLQKSIEKTETSLIVNRSKLNLEYEKQREIAVDITKTEKERAEAAKAAKAAQNELLTMEQQFIDLKIQKMKLEHTLNDTSREDLKELAMLEAQKLEFEAEAAKKRAASTKLLNNINKKDLAEQKKDIDANKKAEEAALKAKEEILKKELAARRAIEVLKIELIEETYQREVEKLKLNTDRKIAELVGSEEQITEQKLLIEQQRDAKLEEYRLAQAEKEKAKAFEAKEEALQQLLIDDEFEKIRLQEKFDLAMISQAQLSDALYVQERQALERKLALIREMHGQESVEYRRANLEILQLDRDRNDEIRANNQATADFKRAIERESLGVAREGFAVFADLLGEDEKNRKKSAGTIKALKSAEVSMGLISEIQKIWEGAATMGPVAGPILGAVQTGIAMARGMMAINRINKTKFAKGVLLRSVKRFFGGNLTKGPSHQAGGIDLINNQTGEVIGEMEGNEPILTKSVGNSPWSRAMVNYINQAAGGRRIYASGGIPSLPAPVNPLTSSNSSSSLSEIQNNSERQQTQVAQSGSQGNEQLVAEFRVLANKIDAWPKNLKVINDPRETFSEQEKIKRVENDASI